MSACISSRGEYSEHTFPHPKAAARGEDRFTCTLCGDFDESAAMEALLAAEAIAEAAREYVAASDAHDKAFQFRDWDSVDRLAGERRVAFDALVAAVDAERAEREGK